MRSCLLIALAVELTNFSAFCQSGPPVPGGGSGGGSGGGIVQIYSTSYVPPKPWDLWIQMDSVCPTIETIILNPLLPHLPGTPLKSFVPVESVTVTCNGLVTDSNYLVYGTSDLLAANWTQVYQFTASSQTNDISFYYTNSDGTWTNAGFFRIYGPHLPVPQYYIVTRTVPVGHEPYLLFALGVLTSTCIIGLLWPLY
jgi:hypothetical protein